MRDYILKNSKKSRERNKDFEIYGKQVIFLEPFENKINFDFIKNKIETLLPSHFFDNVDVFCVGYTKDFFKDGREFNAMFKDGAIYLSPSQDDEKDLLDDIVHEVAHAVEEQNQEKIYSDRLIEREFVAKRRTLYHLLDDKTFNLSIFLTPQYSYKFDNYLYKNIGYDKLRTISSQLFYSPYAITSLREYWANGFENYLLGNREKLKELSPMLYYKIESLLDY
jgi:hypothetical protein